MRKFLVLILAIIFSASSCFAWGWKKKEQPQQSVQDVKIEATGKGYVGTLPDITKNFKTDEPQKTKPVFESSKEFNSADEIKPIPRDNPAFVNIILKQDKTSPYVNELNADILPQLENLLYCIENNFDVQKFNAKAFFFIKTIEYMHDKYQDKPEINYVSFKKLLQLSTHTKTIATLREEAEQYRPYLSYTGAGYLYNDNVINQQLDYLKSEIEQTIVVVKEAR